MLSYVKAKTSMKTGVGDLKNEDGEKTKTDQEKAEVLNNYFQSAFSRENNGPLPQPRQTHFREPIEDFHITEEAIEPLVRFASSPMTLSFSTAVTNQMLLPPYRKT